MPKKAPTVEKPVALSVFARQVGCTSKTIERYIGSGKIHGEAVTQSEGGKNKVYASLALPQYAEAQTNVAHRFARSIHSGSEYGKQRKKGPAAPELTPDEDETLDRLISFGAPGVKEAARLARQSGVAIESGPRRPQAHGGNLKTGPDRTDADITGTANMSEDELSRLDVNQLTKREAVLRVVSKQLEIGKISGELIAISKVEAALFSFGVEIRKRFEAMPARIIDSLLNAKSRSAAIMAFNKEVNSCLDSLAETGNVIETIKNNRGK